MDTIVNLQDTAFWLDGTSLSVALKDHFWIVPTLQSFHILSVCFVLSASVVVGLRAWRVVGTHWTTTQWARRLYPLQWWALLVLLVTGTLQALAEPTRELPNYMFQYKMVAVVVATLVSLWLTRRLLDRDVEHATAMERLACLVMIAIWLGIIFAGRWIAYAQ